MLRRFPLVLTTVLAAAIAAPAAAMPPPAAQEEPTREYARARFKLGVQAYDQGRYKDAIDLFLDAHALVPVPQNSFNIAVTYEAMGDTSSALSWFRTYLREEKAQPDRPMIEARIRTLEARLERRGVQQLSVLSVPTGATVRVDGRPVGVTPWAGELSPGVHRVAIALRGYEEEAVDVELLAARAQDVSVRLEQEGPGEAKPPPDAAPMSRQSTATAPAPAGRNISPYTWITLGVGGAALGGAVAVELGRQGAEQDARGANQVEYPDAVRSMESHRDVARVLAVAGGVITAAGVTLLVLDLSGPSSGPGVALDVSCTPARCGVAGRGTF